MSPTEFPPTSRSPLRGHSCPSPFFAAHLCTKTALVFLLATLSTLALTHHFTPQIPDPTLRLALSFSLVQLTATITLALYLIAQRSFTRFQKNIQDQLRPVLQENITALAFSGQPWPAAVPKHGLARQVLEECLSSALSGLRDSNRDRLTQFAWDQGFARQWQHACSSRNSSHRKHAIALLAAVARPETRALMQNALTDPDPAIRTEAARALLAAAADPAAIDRIFRVILNESLLIRVLLTADLKRHARFLLKETIPAVLAHSPSQQIVHCLEILSAWKLAIPGFDIAPLLDRLEHLPLVVALLPYVQVPDTVEDHLRSALETPDLEIRCAAAHAAGQLKLHALLPTLLPLLDTSINPNARLAAASAQALAQMGPEGERHLHAVLASGDRKASAAAMEALETLAVGIQ
jgi:hypothetical protein